MSMVGTQVYQPPERFALTNGRIVLPDEVIEGQSLLIEGPIMLGLAGAGSLEPGLATIDVGGRFITPGLIDIHTHGAFGHTFNEPDPVAFAAITRENSRRGVTALLATTAAASVSSLVGCLTVAREWMGSAREGAQILGMHLESPYISMAQKGAQDPGNIRRPDDGSADILLEHADVIRIFMYAPELPGALELTRRLERLRIVPAAGHTAASDDEMFAAMNCGLRHVTHLWSAMSTTVRVGPWRKPGVLEVALLSEDLSVEMICDGKHLPPTLMKLGYKCVGPDRLCAISDATSGAGSPEGTRFRMGEMEYDVHDGVGMMLDRTAFAGSTTMVNEMVPILTGRANVPLACAVRMLSLTPARVIGCDGRKGSIAPGKDADLAVFDDSFVAWRTMIGGRWAYAS